MKVVILAGGYGTRISEESYLKPKPMIEIGEKPILWHIMKLYSYYNFNEFIICCGYKQHVIKEWFADYFLYNSDVTFDFTQGNEVTIHRNTSEPWKVTLVDTGLNTMTGGRIKRIQNYVGDAAFCMTYGDAVSDVNISSLIETHKKTGGVATLTAVRPTGRFGVIDISKELVVTNFREKKEDDTGWINGGYMVLEPQIFDYIHGDFTVLEREPLETLSKKGLLTAYKHSGFWQCMDTKNEKDKLEELWNSGTAPWKMWE